MVLDFKNPFGLVQSQPQLNLPSTITPITPPTQKPTISNKNQPISNKNQQLGFMLYALGGALRGDKNFVENTMQLQNIQDAKKREKEMKENWQKALGNLEGSVNPTLVELARVVGPEKGAGLIASGMKKDKDELFKGQGVANQFYNVLLEGQQDPSVRQSPMYKTAYDYLSQPKTETYINEVGQQVTRKIPGMISKEDYLPPPTGLAAVDGKPVVTEEPKVEEIVKVSPERRKTLQTQIDTVDNSERKILAFQKKLDELDPGPLTVGEDRADIESQYTAVLLELKNLEELGVLAGPDLDLLQSMLGDPLSFKQFFVKGGTEGVKKQLNNLLTSIQDRKTPIYKELGMEEPEGTITQTTQTAYLKGRKIKVNATGDGWIYSDTGEAVE